MILVQAALDRAMASMGLGGGSSAADWQQQLQQAARAHGGDWAGACWREKLERRGCRELSIGWQLPLFSQPRLSSNHAAKIG